MQNLIEKFQFVVEDLENEHGELTLFGLFLREEAFEKWDVLVSASWLSPGSLESYTLINSSVQKYIKNENLIKLSRIVILSTDNPFVKKLQETWTGKGQYQLQNAQTFSDALSFNIKTAYLLKCAKI